MTKAASNIQTNYMRTSNKNLIFGLFLLLFTSIWSCTPEEGIGGNSHISGVLVEKYYNSDFTVFQYEKPAKDDDLFLLFGDNNTIDEDVTTSYTGNFKFEYLWPGDYKLFYYSDDTTSITGEDVEIVMNLSLKKNETLNLDTIYSYKALEWNEGSAKISGQIMLINYKNDSKYPNLEIKDITPAQEQEVYINYNNSEFYIDRVRTQADGTFVLPNLLIGDYKIFVYSQDVVTDSTSNVVKSVDIKITQTDQEVILEKIYIEKI